jgi:hypothetical protein
MSSIERIGEHFRTNISNRFIRPTLLQLSLDKETWDRLENLTEKVEQYQYQGYHLDELYNQVLAASRFVSSARRDLVPTLRNRMSGAAEGPDRILRDMAVHNFASNLQLFANMVNRLYLDLKDLDRNDAKGKKPFYMSIPELESVERMLGGG